jgi:hypothetical protein
MPWPRALTAGQQHQATIRYAQAQFGDLSTIRVTIAVPAAAALGAAACETARQARTAPAILGADGFDPRHTGRPRFDTRLNRVCGGRVDQHVDGWTIFSW